MDRSKQNISPHTAHPMQRLLKRCHRRTSGATTLEWVLLLAAIGLPAYWIISMALAALIGHYHMITTLIHLPVP